MNLVRYLQSRFDLLYLFFRFHRPLCNHSADKFLGNVICRKIGVDAQQFLQFHQVLGTVGREEMNPAAHLSGAGQKRGQFL